MNDIHLILKKKLYAEGNKACTKKKKMKKL